MKQFWQAANASRRWTVGQLMLFLTNPRRSVVIVVASTHRRSALHTGLSVGHVGKLAIGMSNADIDLQQVVVVQ